VSYAKEPWTPQRFYAGGDKLGIAHADGGFVGERYEQSQLRTFRDADARRICACVNACIGVPTETLERWARSEGFQGVTAVGVKEASNA